MVVVFAKVTNVINKTCASMRNHYFSNDPQTYSQSEILDKVGLKDITERDPVEEPKQCVERRLDQTRLICLLKDLTAELKDFRKFATH